MRAMVDVASRPEMKLHSPLAPHLGVEPRKEEHKERRILLALLITDRLLVERFGKYLCSSVFGARPRRAPFQPMIGSTTTQFGKVAVAFGKSIQQGHQVADIDLTGLAKTFQPRQKDCGIVDLQRPVGTERRKDNGRVAFQARYARTGKRRIGGVCLMNLPVRTEIVHRIVGGAEGVDA